MIRHMSVERRFGAKSFDAVAVRTDELFDASVDDEKVIDEMLEGCQIPDGAMQHRASPLFAVSLQMIDEMDAIVVRIRIES